MSSPLEIAPLLQKGVAAARAGRSQEAKQLLQQVIKTDPHNEMAWLWLSGLMATQEQKRACLEKVLQANPENVYARAGLTRLQGTVTPVAASTAADILESRLAAVTSGRAPTIKPVTRRPSNGRTADQRATVTTPQPTPTLSNPHPLETTCPVCDQPVSMLDASCPHCYMEFRAVEELLAQGVKKAPPAPTLPPKPRRRGIMSFLAAIVAS